jgi:hypothetical protein
MPIISLTWTSTGGLIALGLGAMNWSVDECAESFENMCRTAFIRRTGSTLPGIGFLVDNYNHSKYETRGLEQTLKNAFTEDENFFGGRRLRVSNSNLKVAITATSLAGQAAIVFGNYNRICEEKRQSTGSKSNLSSIL